MLSLAKLAMKAGNLLLMLQHGSTGSLKAFLPASQGRFRLGELGLNALSLAILLNGLGSNDIAALMAHALTSLGWACGT